MKDAINEAFRDWVTNLENTHYLIGSVVGPHPYPMMVRDFQSVIGAELKAEFLRKEGCLPAALVACVGGGSNAAGTFYPFEDDADVKLFGVGWERGELYGRINARVEAMVERGLFEEALRLKERVPPLSRSAQQAIGYKEIWEGLAAGKPRRAIIDHIQQSTRRFAKQQLTWFRKFPVAWIPATGSLDAPRIAGEIARRL